MGCGHGHHHRTERYRVDERRRDEPSRSEPGPAPVVTPAPPVYRPFSSATPGHPANPGPGGFTGAPRIGPPAAPRKPAERPTAPAQPSAGVPMAGWVVAGLLAVALVFLLIR